MSVWLPSAPCTPGACVERTGSAAAVPRAVLRLAAVVGLILAGLVLSPLGGRIPAGLVRRWCRWIVRAAGVRVRITGEAAPTGAGEGILVTTPRAFPHPRYAPRLRRALRAGFAVRSGIPPSQPAMHRLRPAPCKSAIPPMCLPQAGEGNILH